MAHKPHKVKPGTIANQIRQAHRTHVDLFGTYPTAISVPPHLKAKAEKALEQLDPTGIMRMETCASIAQNEIWLRLYPTRHWLARVDHDGLLANPKKTIAACLQSAGGTDRGLVLSPSVFHAMDWNDLPYQIDFDADVAPGEVWMQRHEDEMVDLPDTNTQRWNG